MNTHKRAEETLEQIAQYLDLQTWSVIPDQIPLDPATPSQTDTTASVEIGHGKEVESTSHLNALEYLGQQIGNYQLVKEIGEGTFGIVFEARQCEPIQRSVALKILKPGMDSRRILAHFRSEHRVLAMMDHPNVAAVFDAGLTPAGRPFFVMELVDGKPITDYCDAARLTILQRLRIFCTVCDAVHHAHSKGIVHRDLKPQNILVARDGTLDRVKIVDFGVAQVLGSDPSITSGHTGRNELIGTPRYMSPEQTVGDHRWIDSRSDVYSLGVLLYELLTGTTPLPNDGEQQVLQGADSNTSCEVEILRPSDCAARLSADKLAAIALARSTPPRQLAQQIHRELEWIVTKALEGDPARRYETARGLRDDVERYLRGDLVQARPPSMVYMLRKRLARGRAAWLMRSSLVVATLFCILIGWLLYREVDYRRRVALLRDLHVVANDSWRNSDLAVRRQLYQDVQALQQNLLGDRDPTTWWTQVHISQICAEQEQFKEAVDLAEQAYSMLLETQGADGPYTKHCATHLINCYNGLIWETLNPDPAQGVEPLERVPAMTDRALAILQETEKYGYYLPGHKISLMAYMGWYYALIGDTDGLERVGDDLQQPTSSSDFMFWLRAMAHQTLGRPEVAKQCLAVAHDRTAQWFFSQTAAKQPRKFADELNLRVNRYLGISQPWQLAGDSPADLIQIYTALLREYPADPVLLFGRGVNHARCNDWQRAADDFAAAVAERPDVFKFREAFAIAQLQIQATEDYRETCRIAARRFAFSPEFERRLLLICLLSPEYEMEAEAIQLYLRDSSLRAPISTLAHYRLGNYDATLQSAELSDSPILECLKMIIGSMSHHRSGSPQAAEKLLRLAQQKIGELIPSADGPPVTGDWFAERPLCWALVNTLQNEAEALIQPQ